MKIKRRVVFGLLVAGLLFFAGILLRDFLLANFVKPVALLLWTAGRLISSIDQAAYWAGLILALTAISLLRYLRRPAASEEGDTGIGNTTLHSIRHWRTLILMTSDDSDRLHFLKNALRTLLKELYASKQSSQASWKVFEEFEQGDIPLPGSIREFLKIDAPSNGHPDRMQPPSQAPARFARRWAKQDREEYYQSIADVISFMEKELENEDEQ